MEALILVICPYCQNKFKIRVEVAVYRPSDSLIYCDIEETPGCGKMFAIKTRFIPEVTTFQIVQEKAE